LLKVAIVALLSRCMEVAARKREQGRGVWLVGSHRHRPHSGGIKDMEVADVR
jgi:hypothetical protein